MKYNEFQRPIAIDFAPRGRVCEWCGQPAERQLTAIGGTHHNQSGIFCGLCGEKFLENVIKGLLAEKQVRHAVACAS